MYAAPQTMIDNLKTNTGKSLEEWVTIVKNENFEKHGQIISFLNEKHNFNNGIANLVAHKSKSSDADSAADSNYLIEKLYTGKGSLKPIYDKLLNENRKFGNDVETAPKNAYVSMRRKKQFAILQPATKIKFEIALNLKGEKATGKLEEIKIENAMCSHKINIWAVGDIDKEIINWLKLAYEKTG